MAYESTEKMLAESEQRVRDIASDRAAYTPQYGPTGAISTAPGYTGKAAVPREHYGAGQVQDTATDPFAVRRAMQEARVEPGQALNLRYGATDVTATRAAGTGRGRVNVFTEGARATGDADQQERDKEMTSRGMVKDYNGNWAPPGGRGVQKKFGDMTWIEAIQAAGEGRERKALGRMAYEAQLARQAAGEERAAALPEREARIGQSAAQTKLLGAQARTAESAALMIERDDAAQEIVNNPSKYGGAGSTRVLQAQQWLARKQQEKKDIINEQAMAKLSAEQALYGDIQKRAQGGEVEGYADGGAVGRAQTGQLNPMVSQYGQYLQAASQSGVAPVPFAQYINLLSSTRGAMQQTPTQFADGGDVSALRRPIQGPGTETSDSIPAVIDGGRPAALSDGEFVIPANVVRKKGTEFFEKLIAQYSEGAQQNG